LNRLDSDDLSLGAWEKLDVILPSDNSFTPFIEARSVVPGCENTSHVVAVIQSLNVFSSFGGVWWGY
jgi:hypothetical protein